MFYINELIPLYTLYSVCKFALGKKMIGSNLVIFLDISIFQPKIIEF